MDLTDIRTLYKETEKYTDTEVTVGGWVRSNRDSKTFGFLTLSDGTYFNTLQVVYADSLKNFPDIAKTNVGTAVIAKGRLVATPEAKQPFEIQASEIVIEGAAGPDYPLQKKRHTLEYLRTMTHLRARTPRRPGARRAGCPV